MAKTWRIVDRNCLLTQLRCRILWARKAMQGTTPMTARRDALVGRGRGLSGARPCEGKLPERVLTVATVDVKTPAVPMFIPDEVEFHSRHPPPRGKTWLTASWSPQTRAESCGRGRKHRL